MTRKTKIICTIGPACENEETLIAMCQAGMNVARLNFSHGTHEEHLKRIEMIRSVREKLNLPIAIMLDTKGPEYRTDGLHSHNPAYGMIPLSGEETVRCVGRVIGKLKEEQIPNEEQLNMIEEAVRDEKGRSKR